MATAAQIELVVDASGAVTGLRNFDAAVKATTADTRSLDAELKSTSTAATQLGSAGAKAGTAVADGLDKISGHALTSLDNVRLLRDDLGIRIPRAMERAIASSAQLSTAINGVGTVLIALGALEIFTRIGEEAYGQISNIAGFTDAVKKAREEMVAYSNQQLANPGSIGQSQQNLKYLSAGQSELERKRAASVGPGWFGATVDAINPFGEHFSEEDDKALQASIAATSELRKNSTKLVEEQNKAERELSKTQLEAAHAQDGALRGYARANAERQKGLDLAKTEHEGRIAELNPEQRAEYYNQPGGRVRKTEDGRYAADVKKVEGENAAQRIDLSRQVRDARIAAENEAVDAGLKGYKLLEAQERQALAAVRRKASDGDPVDVAAETAAIQKKFDNERLERLKQQREEVEKMERAAQGAGYTGLAKIQAAGREKLGGIDARERDGEFYDTDSSGHSALAGRERAAVNQQTNADILAAQKSFTEEIDGLARQSEGAQLQGYAHIRAAADQHIAELERKFNEMYGQLDHSSQLYVAGQQKLLQGVAVIQSDAGREKLDLDRKNADETLQLEQQAAAKGLSPEREKTAMLYAEYEARSRKLKEELDNQQISYDDYNRRVAANDKLLQDELVAQQRETTQKLAGVLEKFFKNPMEALKDEGEKAMAQSTAKMITLMMSPKSPAGATGTPESTGHSLLSSMTDGFSGMFGVPRLGRNKIGAAPGGGGPHESTMAITTATIHIGTATILGGAAIGGAGAPGAPGSVGGIGTGSGVGTSLYGLGTPSGAVSGAVSGAPSAGTAAGDMAAAMGGGYPTPSASGDSSTSSQLRQLGTTGGGLGYGGGGSTVLGQSQSALNTVSSGVSMVKQFQALRAAAKGTQQIGQTGQLLSASGPTAADGTATGAGTAYGDMNQAMGGDGVHDANGVVGGMGGSGATGLTMSGAIGAAQGGLGVAGAYQKHSFVTGALGGAMSGAEGGAAIGMMVGGPAGALFGAAAGAIVGAEIGFIGGFHSPQAEQYDKKTVKPQLGALLFTYGQGGDYMSAEGQINDIQRAAMDATNKMGGAGQRYYQSHIKKEIEDVKGQIDKEEKAGRSNFTASTAQFHSGGYVNDFGDLGTSSTEGFAHLMKNEFVVRSQAAQQNPASLAAINAGHNMDAMMSHYRAAVAQGTRGSGGGDRTLNMNVHAIDLRGADLFFRQYRGLMARHLNAYDSDYGGEARG